MQRELHLECGAVVREHERSDEAQASNPNREGFAYFLRLPLEHCQISEHDGLGCPCVAEMRDFNVTPHVAQNTTNRLSAIDHRTTRHRGYEISQQKRKRVEEPFGWGKTIGGLARPMLRGEKKLDFKFTLTMAAYDLIKLPRLIGAAA